MKGSNSNKCCLLKFNSNKARDRIIHSIPSESFTTEKKMINKLIKMMNKVICLDTVPSYDNFIANRFIEIV